MEFVRFPKIPRLKRGMFVTEKIDGTNGQIVIQDRRLIDAGQAPWVADRQCNEGGPMAMFAGSRNRYLSKHKDNFGFYKWVRENSEELMKLGSGTHYGEWWGYGVGRTYGLDEKRFSLFNVGRWGRPEATLPDCVHVVPELYRGEMDLSVVNANIDLLKKAGSVAAPGFMKPEGVVVFHTALNGYFKVLCENDDIPKGEV
jgi:hypothetical protein